jgi:hypothetical protein
MKKTYLKPEAACIEIKDGLLFSEESYLPINNGGTSGQTDDDDETDDYNDLLSKPTTIYVAWDDDDFDI